MNKTNHECYVSLGVAKLLKEAGFDWDTHSAYNKDGVFADKNRSITTWNNFTDYYSAPTLDVTQRWLREVKGIYIEITTIENKRAVTNSDGWTFHYEYDKPTFDCDIKDERCENMCTLYDSFDTYEEAQEAGIKKALEIILDKGE